MQIEITEKERSCLLALGEMTGSFPPRLVDIARKLKVKPPTALNLVRRLEAKGLASEKRGQVLITKAGKKEYSNIVLAHRCLETLFSKAGIPADCACRQARKLDYLVAPAYARKLFNYLGNPKYCPHGKPIVVTIA